MSGAEGAQAGVSAVLIRHFPTDWNLERRLQGRTDRPLTEAARTALAALALPEPWPEASIWASPLSRAAETARFLAAGRPVAQDVRLMELSWGDWEGHTAEALMADPATGFVPTASLGWAARPPGGESAAEAWARVQPCLAAIAAAGLPAVIVSHKALMRVILAQAEAAAAGTAAPRHLNGAGHAPGGDGVANGAANGAGEGAGAVNRETIPIKRGHLYPVTIGPDGTVRRARMRGGARQAGLRLVPAGAALPAGRPA
ncbi:MAG: histidine phosphatase family protein [Pseudomonadota bacterium]